jgi:hypothetical protein
MQILYTTRRLWGAVGAIAAIAMLSAAVAALPAGADPWHGGTVTLNGDWAPFNRCPVESSTMLAANGTATIALCVVDDSPGEIVINGNTLMKTPDVNAQFGAVLNNETDETTIAAPADGVMVATPAEVPGGIRSLLCPDAHGPAGWICDHHNRWWHEPAGVTGEILNAGAPSNFVLAAGIGVEQPIVTLRSEIRLVNPLLGWNCSIGSSSEPIVVSPENLTPPTGFAIESFEADGTPVEDGTVGRIVVEGSTQGDPTLVMPGAHGCGPGGVFDQAIDNKLGLPAAAGKSSIVLSAAKTYLGLLANPGANDGEELAKDWQSAVVAPKGHKGWWHHW